MGILGDALGFVGDTFFGGDEKDAAKEARLGAERAAQAELEGINRAIDYQTDATGQALAIQDPYLQTSGYANQAYARAMGLPTYDLQDRTFSPRVGPFEAPPGVLPSREQARQQFQSTQPQAISGLPTRGLPKMISADASRDDAERRYRQLIDRRVNISGSNARSKAPFLDELKAIRNAYPEFEKIDSELASQGRLANVPKFTSSPQPRGVLGSQTSPGMKIRGFSSAQGAGSRSAPDMVFAGGTPGFYDGPYEGTVVGMDGEPTEYSYNQATQPGGVLGKLDSVEDPDPYGGFRESPGYQFARDEGLKGIERALSARGLVESGKYPKEAARFATGLADQTFGNYMSRLLGAQTGAAGQASNTTLNAGTNLGNLAVSSGRAAGQGMFTAGQARASGILGANKARGDTITGIARMAAGFM